MDTYTWMNIRNSAYLLEDAKKYRTKAMEI